MKTKYYCCDANRDLYERYYLDQSGSGIPYYQGAFQQRGHGLGSMLSGLFKSVWPMIRSGLQRFGKHAARTGLNIAGDVVEGSSLRDSVEKRVPEGIKTFVSSQFNQSGRGKRKRLVVKRSRKKSKRDIFC